MNDFKKKGNEEAKIDKKIKAYVMKNYPSAFLYKVHGGKFQKAGIPDWDITINGINIKVETKTETGRLSPVQRTVIKELEQADANVFVCYGFDDFKIKLKEVLDLYE